MRKSFLPLIAILGLMFTGVACSVDEFVPEQEREEQTTPQNDDKVITISATLEQAETRTELGESYTVCWSADDQIRVFNASTPAGELFTLQSGAGTTSATFSGNALSGEGPYYAVYPASAAGSLADGAVSLTIPSSQAYAAGSFGNGYNISASQSDNLTAFSFKNVGGAICFKITGEASVRQINLYTKGTEPLYGSATVSFSEGLPSLSWAADQSDEAFRMVSLDCGSTGAALGSDATAFYMTLPAGALAEGFTIEVIDAGGNAMVKNVAGSSAQIERSRIRPMPSFAYSAKYNSLFLSSTAPAGAFSGVLAGGTFAEGCVYSEDSGQYAYNNAPSGDDASRYLRIQDWNAGFALGLTTPYVLNAGTTVSVVVESLGATGVNSMGATEMKVLKKVGNRVWIADTTDGYGFIMMLVED